MSRAVVDLVLLSAAIAVSVPIAVFLLECLASLWPPRSPAPGAAKGGRIAVVIPAHNEEAAIAETIRSIRSQVEPDDSVLVVADNCSDATAERAREAGAEVL